MSRIVEAYAAVQIPGGWIVHRCGVERPYAIRFSLWCVASAMTGAAHTLDGLIVVRLLIG